MLKTIVVTTEQQTFPAGTVAGGVLLAITAVDPGNLVPDPMTLTGPYATDVDLNAGDYVVVAQAVDANAVPLGVEVSVSFTVVGADVLVDVPVSISLT